MNEWGVSSAIPNFQLFGLPRFRKAFLKSFHICRSKSHRQSLFRLCPLFDCAGALKSNSNYLMNQIQRLPRSSYNWGCRAFRDLLRSHRWIRIFTLFGNVRLCTDIFVNSRGLCLVYVINKGGSCGGRYSFRSVCRWDKLTNANCCRVTTIGWLTKLL